MSDSNREIEVSDQTAKRPWHKPELIESDLVDSTRSGLGVFGDADANQPS